LAVENTFLGLALVEETFSLFLFLCEGNGERPRMRLG
jgi:hypothetical protein